MIRPEIHTRHRFAYNCLHSQLLDIAATYEKSHLYPNGNIIQKRLKKIEQANKIMNYYGKLYCQLFNQPK